MALFGTMKHPSLQNHETFLLAFAKEEEEEEELDL